MNQILLGLGLNVTGWKNGTKSVRDDMKGVEKDWKDFGKLLKLGGVVAVVRGVFSEIIASAQETRAELEKLGQPIPESTRSVAAFGDALKQVREGAASAAVSVLGFFTRAGEGYGTLINRLRGISAEQEKINDESARNAEVQSAAAAKLREANSPEKIKAAEQELAAVRTKAAFDQADNQQKLNLLIERRDQLEAKVNGTVAGSLPNIQAQKELVQTEVELARQRAVVTKESADADQAMAATVAEIVANQKKSAQERVALEKQLHEQKLASLPLAEKIAAEEDEIGMLQTKQLKYGKESNEYKTIQVEINKRNAELTADQTELTNQLAEAEQKRLAIAKNILTAQQMNYAVYTKFMNDAVLGGVSSGQIQDASDEALKEKIRRNNAAKSPLLGDQGDAFHFGNSLEITRLENENRRIQAELDLRDKLRSDVGFFGVDNARRNFSGDPLVFDRLVQQFVSGRTEQAQGNEFLRQINENLKAASNTELASGITKLTDSVSVVGKVLSERGLPTGG